LLAVGEGGVVKTGGEEHPLANTSDAPKRSSRYPYEIGGPSKVYSLQVFALGPKRPPQNPALAHATAPLFFFQVVVPNLCPRSERTIRVPE